MSPPLSRRRKALYSALLIALITLLLEVMSVAALAIADGKVFQPEEAQAARHRARRMAAAMSNVLRPVENGSSGGVLVPYGAQGDVPPEVVHPFLGYVRDPTIQRAGHEVGPHGFYSHPPPPGEEDPVRVGVLGGSVAAGVSTTARAELARALEESKAFGDRKVWVRSFALGGYKQPQQLLTLTYLLALGETFDVVINLDGFNEVAFALSEVEGTGLNPFYPRRWPRRMAGLPDRDAQRLVGEIAFLEARRLDQSGWCSAPVLRSSPTCHLLWRAFESWSNTRLVDLREALAIEQSVERTYLTHGPQSEYENKDELLDSLAEVWGRSSLRMHRICRSEGILYAHFLQPNQYDAGSKPLGAAERKTAIDPSNEWNRLIPAAYDRLSRVGAEVLLPQSVAFHDLRRVFEKVEEPLYTDKCCHFSGPGERLLADAIGAAVADRVRRMTERPSRHEQEGP